MRCFGEENFISEIIVSKTSSQTSTFLSSTCDVILWYARKKAHCKFRALFNRKDVNNPLSGAGEYKNFWMGFGEYLTTKQAQRQHVEGFLRFRPDNTISQSGSKTTTFDFQYNGKIYKPTSGGWKSNFEGFIRLAKAGRFLERKTSISYVRFLKDFPVVPISDLWTDVRWGFDASEKRYVVETNARVVQRCLLLSTDPGDLVLDPTCGSGTTAYVAEQWGRRWITIDTSRVALALARARIMGARYSYYLLSDSRDGQLKEAEIASRAPADTPTYNNIWQGFVYERVPHITLKSIANNAEIDVIWEKWQEILEPLCAELNASLNRDWEEWEIPREPGDPWSATATAAWSKFQAARTNEAKSAALCALNQELGRDYTPDDVPDRPLDPWESTPHRPPPPLVGTTHRPTEGDRHLHRRQGRLRIPLRQALREQEDCTRGRSFHGREPKPPPRAWRG